MNVKGQRIERWWKHDTMRVDLSEVSGVFLFTLQNAFAEHLTIKLCMKGGATFELVVGDDAVYRSLVAALDLWNERPA